MCFVNDCDWIARINESTDGPAVKPVHCDECGIAIGIGEVHRHIYQQEHEECPGCEDGDCDGVNCDFGETYECDICGNCCKLLDVIRRVEIESGCSPYESQPALGELADAMFEDGYRDGGKYLERAKLDHPEMALYLSRYEPTDTD